MLVPVMSAAANIAVHCRGLTKSYGSGEGRVAALRGVDLDVFVGELLMLVGPSGCGKTTLISIISSILDADEGLCEVLGCDVRKMDEPTRTAFRGESIGFVFQAFNLLPALTALENVSVPLLLRKLPRAQAETRALAVLDSVGLSGRSGALPAKLSGGEQQRVAFARALVHNPRLLICDEPTSNLDTRAGHEVMEILRNIARTQQRSLIVVSHDNRIFGYADRIVHMEDGRIVEPAVAELAEAVP